MSIAAEQRPGTVQQPAVQYRPAAEKPTEKGAEERGWLLALGVFLAAALVFGAMVVLTALAGGDAYNLP
ncbi:hypothetical protein [Blastococcus saxobsidens]|uniref:Uncharacterized protein n=1 Tax=Blastococcus saxobsidens (strain DD2) TaxID=1146883 RepID=H6RUI9_BLASD|nr:hypothetical protein [Blastococcus saxobsidens]CCG01954.1 protein of unknown function [Blastococcus saxobsidens DD2]